MIQTVIRSGALLLVLVGRPAAFAAASASLAVAPGDGGERRPEGLHDEWVGELSVSTSAQTDLTGKWSASFDTQIGRQDYTYQFQLKGDKLTGSASSANGESEIQNGKVEDDTVAFVENFKYQGMTIVITYSGRIVSPDEIRFTRQVGEFATEEFVASRVKP